MDPKTCLNCDHPTSGHFCSNCGQSTKAHRITFSETIDDFLSSTFALQGPLMHTIWMLIVRPGKMLHEFLDGKRKAYYKPVSFFVLMTVIYLLVRELINYDPLAGQQYEGMENYPERVRQSQMAARWMVTHINNVMLILVFSIAIVQKALFPRKNNLAEYLSIGFYISGIYTLAGLFMMLIIHYVFRFPGQVQLLFLLFYTFYVVYSFHQKHKFFHILRYILSAIFGLLLYILLGFGLSYFVVVYWK
ncbi:MAG: DUF3667 domain-containing protein [Cyclobacteriaceae bacterium]